MKNKIKTNISRKSLSIGLALHIIMVFFGIILCVRWALLSPELIELSVLAMMMILMLLLFNLLLIITASRAPRTTQQHVKKLRKLKVPNSQNRVRTPRKLKLKPRTLHLTPHTTEVFPQKVINNEPEDSEVIILERGEISDIPCMDGGPVLGLYDVIGDKTLIVIDDQARKEILNAVAGARRKQENMSKELLIVCGGIKSGGKMNAIMADAVWVDEEICSTYGGVTITEEDFARIHKKLSNKYRSLILLIHTHPSGIPNASWVDTETFSKFSTEITPFLWGVGNEYATSVVIYSLKNDNIFIKVVKGSQVIEYSGGKEIKISLTHEGR